MAIVAGFDVHRSQITFDALDTESGEVSRGRIDATPAAVARWIGRFDRRARGRQRRPALQHRHLPSGATQRASERQAGEASANDRNQPRLICPQPLHAPILYLCAPRELTPETRPAR